MRRSFTTVARRVLALPLLHFVVLGGALQWVTSAVWPRRETSAPVVVGAGALASREAEWAWQHGAAPNTAQRAEIASELIDEEVLYRAAVDTGLDRHDPMVRRRLAQLATFVGEDVADEEQLVRAAAALGLDRGDVVIRRHLVGLARLAAGRLDPEDLPSEPEMSAWLAAHPERFATPERVTLTHVYLATRPPGDARLSEATTLLAAIRRDGVTPAAAVARGDAFIRGATLRMTRAELERTFGADFAAAVWGGAVASWLGPVASAYGAHLVWIDGRSISTVPALAQVRGRILQEMLRERRATRRAERLGALRARYAVRVEGRSGG